MRRDDVLQQLRQHADLIRSHGAESLYIYGSTARDEARVDSDLDAFIDIAPNRKFSLIDLAGMQLMLGDQLGLSIDLTTRGSLHPKLRDAIEREAIRVF